MSGVIKDLKKDNFSFSSNLQVDYLISGPLEWKTLSSGDLYLIFLLRDMISNDSLNKRSRYEKIPYCSTNALPVVLSAHGELPPRKAGDVVSPED